MMQTLEQLRHRLDTFDDLGSLVRTMKALAAASIHLHEHAVRSLGVYYRTVELGLHVVLRDLDPWPQPPHVPRSAPQAAVVFGSDHGMCGRFNQVIAEHAAERLQQSRREHASVRVLAIGARVAAGLEDAGIEPDALQPVPASTGRITAGVRRILVAMDRWGDEGVVRVRLFHNRQASGSGYAPVTVRVLPVDFDRFRALTQESWESKVLPTYSMPRDSLLSALLRQYFFVTVFRACAESLASENAARLAAMQAAERSLGERRETLSGELRRARQHQITAELLDVVAGFEATQAGHDAG